MASSPKEDWINDFTKLIDDQFYNSSDWFTIQEETSFGSGEYTDIDVRVNYVFNPTTGINMGDDWKLLMFSDISKQVKFGSMFYFDENYWVTINVENLKNLTSTCVVRRCNNTLRWLDDNGELLTVPCVLDYNITENRNYASAMSAMVNPSGILQVISQLNETSNKINPNQRFLFGNQDSWIGYKVQGGGVNNFDNHKTLVNSTNGILKLTLSADFVNEDTDDLIRGIADVYEHVYTINVYGASSGQVGTTSQLVANVLLNGLAVDRNVTWSSDDEAVATVSSSGLVTFISSGTANITATLQDNADVYGSISVETLLVPATEYTVQISPDSNYILEGSSKTFTVTLYLNSVAQPDAFSFSLNPNTVPSANYNFTVIDGNSFSIENVKMFLTDTLDVECTSGATVKTFSFKLQGGW